MFLARPARLLLATTAAVGLAGSAHAQSDPGATVVTHHETIPNPVFGSGFRVAAACRNVAQPCAWEQPGTWTAGAVPDLASRVIVDGRVRIHGAAADALAVGIYPGGALVLQPRRVHPAAHRGPGGLCGRLARDRHAAAAHRVRVHGRGRDPRPAVLQRPAAAPARDPGHRRHAAGPRPSARRDLPPHRRAGRGRPGDHRRGDFGHRGGLEEDGTWWRSRLRRSARWLPTEPAPTRPKTGP